MTSTRLQHLVPATLVLLLAVTVTYLSYTSEPAESFLFPRLIAGIMTFLAIWNFARAALGIAKVGTGFSKATLITIAPGLAVVAIYVFFLAKLLGFYFSSALVFVVIFSIYDPAPHTDPKSWTKRISIAAAFTVLMYGLFSMLLKVQTPRGIFF